MPSGPLSCSFSCSWFGVSGDSMWTLTSSDVTLDVAWPFKFSLLIVSSGRQAGAWLIYTHVNIYYSSHKDKPIKKWSGEHEAWDEPWSGTRTPFLMSSSLVCLVEIFLSSTRSQTAQNNQERLLQPLTQKPTHAWHKRRHTLPLIVKAVAATLTPRCVKRPRRCRQGRISFCE